MLNDGLRVKAICWDWDCTSVFFNLQWSPPLLCNVWISRNVGRATSRELSNKCNRGSQGQLSVFAMPPQSLCSKMLNMNVYTIFFRTFWCSDNWSVKRHTWTIVTSTGPTRQWNKNIGHIPIPILLHHRDKRNCWLWHALKSEQPIPSQFQS